MSEFEVFLNKHERLDNIKLSLRRVIEAASGEDEKDVDFVVRHALEDFFIYVEAAGPELHLNEREKNVLNAIKGRAGASFKDVARLSSQLFGALNQDSRFPEEWKDEKDLVKDVFLFELKDRINEVLKNETLENILELEELISGFTLHENQDLDRDILKLCSNVGACINEVLIDGKGLNKARLEIQKKIATTV
jgi:hypothetical protein